MRPTQGWYETEDELYYVASDGTVYLYTTPDAERLPDGTAMRGTREADDALMAAYDDAQEAQIRELADALEAVLSYHQECRFVEEYPYHGQCEAHDWIEQTAGACVHKTAREALIKARGDK